MELLSEHIEHWWLFMPITVYRFVYLLKSTIPDFMTNCLNLSSSNLLNKYCKQHLTKKQLYGHLPPVSQTIKIRWLRYASHCWRSKDESIGNVLLWNPAHKHANVGWSAMTYIHQLCGHWIPSRRPSKRNGW